MSLRTLLTIAACAAAALLPASAASASDASPVLGKRGLFPGGKGWGTAHPRTIFNGGSPGGLADNVRWTGWGKAKASGSGVIAAYKPQGGYYARRVPIQFRALRLGRCQGSARRAYTRLLARAYDRPGGSYGGWHPWTLDLCNANARAAPCGFVAFAENSDFGAFQITAWDVSCTTARAVAAASRDVAFTPDSSATYRFQAERFRCEGFVIDEDSLPSVSYTCYRNTAVVSFTRS